MVKFSVRIMCHEPLLSNPDPSLATVAFSPQSKEELKAAVNQCDNKRKREDER